MGNSILTDAYATDDQVLQEVRRIYDLDVNNDLESLITTVEGAGYSCKATRDEPGYELFCEWKTIIERTGENGEFSIALRRVILLGGETARLNVLVRTGLTAP